MPIHPYIPNSDPEAKKKILKEIGVRDVEELFAEVPDKIRFKGELKLPHSTPEHEVKKQTEATLSKNRTTNETLSFLGAGCWPHYVPAVCDEINSRSEFLTAYTGDVYSDLGRYQALFEFQSMIGELVALDAVTFPTYDWATACGDAARMAAIATGRHEILVPKTISPDRLSTMQAYCSALAQVKTIDFQSDTGQLHLADLKEKISSKTAAVYIENPTYLGFIETQCEEIGSIAHQYGGLLVVGVEPLSLAVLKPPGEYGADIVCGEGQPLGLHMSFGGVSLGFLACQDEERLLYATGHRLLTITKTEHEGQWGFTYALPERSMLTAREKAASITGTATVLWAITAAVYMSLLGPKGMQELAELIMSRSNYAIKRISQVRGVKVPVFDSAHFKEFTVNFDETGRSVGEVNEALLRRGIQGGKDVSKEFPELGSTSLYCVTEVHSKEDIDRLASTLAEVVK